MGVEGFYYSSQSVSIFHQFVVSVSVDLFSVVGRRDNMLNVVSYFSLVSVVVDCKRCSAESVCDCVVTVCCSSWSMCLLVVVQLPAGWGCRRFLERVLLSRRR